MPNYNKAILIGHVTRDPEVKTFGGGQALTTGTVAVSKHWKDKATGERKEATSFIDFKFWGKGGEVFAQYVRKGDPIMIEGALEQESWTDKTTQAKRSKLVVNVEEFQQLKSRTESGGEKGKEDGFDPSQDADEPF